MRQARTIIPSSSQRETDGPPEPCPARHAQSGEGVVLLLKSVHPRITRRACLRWLGPPSTSRRAMCGMVIKMPAASIKAVEHLRGCPLPPRPFSRPPACSVRKDDSGDHGTVMWTTVVLYHQLGSRPGYLLVSHRPLQFANRWALASERWTLASLALECIAFRWCMRCRCRKVPSARHARLSGEMQSAVTLSANVQVLMHLSSFGYDQGVMGGVNTSPDYVRTMGIGYSTYVNGFTQCQYLCSRHPRYAGPSEGYVATITEPTKQGGIVSIYYFGTLLGSLMGGIAGDRYVMNANRDERDIEDPA